MKDKGQGRSPGEYERPGFLWGGQVVPIAGCVGRDQETERRSNAVGRQGHYAASMAEVPKW